MLNEKPKKSFKLLGFISSFIVESIEAIIIALFVSSVLYIFIVTPHKVSGDSMKPNLIPGEYILANKLEYRFSEPERGDIIIFKHSPTQDYVKRIIGLPGETIALRDGIFYIDGERLDESDYLNQTVITDGGNALNEGDEIEIEKDEYFVVGDNRTVSLDSRATGSIDKSDIRGKAWVIYFPFSEARNLDNPNYQ